MLQFLAMHVSSVSLVLRITPAPRFAWRWIGQVDRRAMGEQETGGCRFIEHCPLLAHGTIPCIWLKQYCLQTSIDLNSFRFQFAVSLMALKTLALILPVVLAVIPDPDWQAFKNKFQKILGWVCHQHLYHNVQVIVWSSTGTGFVFAWYTAMSLSLSKDS